MPQTVHGECANGGGGGNLSETQACPTLRPWPPYRRVPANDNNIDLPVDSCDNFVQSASRAPGHDCPSEAFAAGWDTTALSSSSPNSAVASSRSSLSPFSSAVEWHPPPPHPTPPSSSPPNYVITSPNSFLNFVSANAMVVILYGIPSLIMLSLGLVRWHADVELHSTSTMVLLLVLVVLTWILLYCISRVRSNFDHLLWIGPELRLAAMIQWFQLIKWARDLVSAGLRGWAPRHGLMNRVETASLSLLGSRFSALLSGSSDIVFNLITKVKNIVSAILILAYGYRYFNTKLVTVVSLLGLLLLLPLVFCGIHLRMTAGSAEVVLGKYCDDEECYYEINKPNRQKKPGMVWWIVIASATFLVVMVVVVVAVCCIAALLWYKCGNRGRQNEPQVQLELQGVSGPRRFEFDELVAATNNFSDENKLGQGGFSPVYGGFLRDQDRHVAIKMLSAETSWQGKKEFDAEVKVLTQLRHRNIVELVGWYDSNEGLLLVYKLMAQGSLDKHLYNPVRILSWQQRYKIILDLGSAFYLHHCCDKCIVHGNIKPENVMLDALFNAKFSDFGTARLVEHGAEPRTTEIVAGTRGYIDPDFVNSHLRCPEADMYGFGVALLEIASGKRPASRQPNEAPALPVWIRNLYDRGMILDAADGKMNGEFDRQQMERVLVTGLWCAHQYPSRRPSTKQARDVIRCVDATLLVLSATHDAQRVCFLEEQAYGDLTGEDGSVDAVATSTLSYFQGFSLSACRE